MKHHEKSVPAAAEQGHQRKAAGDHRHIRLGHDGEAENTIALVEGPVVVALGKPPNA